MEDITKKENINLNKEDNIVICPNCKKNQEKIIKVNICDTELNGSIWYKCSITNTCPLFQIKK
jgi:hypothetical protein